MLRLYRSKVPQREEKGDNEKSGNIGYTDRCPAKGGIRMQRLYKSKARRGRKRATIKRAGAGAVHTKGRQRDEKGDYKESGRKGYTDQRLA